MEVEIPRAVLDQIRASARADPAREVCGLLLGEDGRVMCAEPTANVSAEADRAFEIDPAALFRAIRAERAGGHAILGYYHSHPCGPALPSERDAAEAAPDGRLWLIVAGDATTLWRAVPGGAVHGRFDPVSITSLPGFACIPSSLASDADASGATRGREPA